MRLAFLGRILAEPDFTAGQYDTLFAEALAPGKTKAS